MLIFLYGFCLLYVFLLRPVMFRTPIRLIEGGRITIPVDVRRHLDLEIGDPIVVTIEAMGRDS